MWQVKIFFGNQFEDIEDEINRFIRVNHIVEFTLDTAVNDYTTVVTMKYKQPVVKTNTPTGAVYCIM